ncbi:MAG: ABC transporter permease [Acidobacteriia bacterium]|nr:ABC transporter permease [Terriglobia bacterium]
MRYSDDIAQDVRFGIRMLAKSPGFLAVAVLSLALGIGTSTAIFSLLNQAMFEPLPVKNPQELVQVLLAWPGGSRSNLDYSEFRSLTENRQSFSSVLIYGERELNFRSDNLSERILAHLVSGSFYSTLGVDALVGRTITEEDDRGAASPVAVLSYAFWERRFARNPAVLGKTVYISNLPFTIVGVTPPGFFGTDRLSVPDITVPLATLPLPGSVHCLGRLKPDVSLTQARAELAVLLHQAVNEMSAQMRDWTPRDRQLVLDLRVDLMRAGSGNWGMQLMLAEALPILILSAGVLLLIGCMNVANLLLGRAAVRSREISIRLALGAGRMRITRQLLTESILLSLVGGMIGLFFEFWAHYLLKILLPFDASASVQFLLDRRILVFTAVASMLTGILFGTAPALHATRVEVARSLKGAMPLTTRQRRLGPARSLLVVELAGSLILLVGAALFVRTLRNLRTFDAGFERQHILLLTLDPRESRFKNERLNTLFDELTAQVEAIPGVRSAALAHAPLLMGSTYRQKTLWVEGYNYAPNENQFVSFNSVGPGFFANAGIPLLLGRDFGPQDRINASPVAIVNEALVHKYLPNQNPIGKRFGDEGSRSVGKYEIVGVVKDAKFWNLREGSRPTEFQLLGQLPENRPFVLHVRTTGNPSTVTASIRQVIQSIDRNLVLYDVRTMTDQVNQTLRHERMFATLSMLFGVMALGMACIGLYGVATYSVARRTSEIGLRMALGARRRDVLWMVLKETLSLVAFGAAIGTPVALACSRFVRSLLFGLTPADPATIAFSILVLVSVATLASFLPAWRASRVDPMVALRHE